MTKDEALKLALEALEKSTKYFNIVRLGESRLKDTEIRGTSHAAITAIKEALAQPEPKCIACEGRPSGDNDPCSVCGLAQPEQEPVEDVVAYHSDGTRTVRIAPKRQWVGLTDEEIDCVTIKCFGPNADLEFHRHHARAVEAKLKELNT